MQINALRGELNALLSVPGLSRTAAVRRCSDPDWLYMTDFPSVAGRETLAHVLAHLSRAGWEYEEANGRLLLRKDTAEPPEGWFAGPFGAEAGCCLSLLERHAGNAGNGAEAVRRMLIKAGEEGGRACEEACAKLHREWAGRLRKGELPPAVSLKYFGG